MKGPGHIHRYIVFRFGNIYFGNTRRIPKYWLQADEGILDQSEHQSDRVQSSRHDEGSGP
jgi:hypothetical protein